MLPRRWTQDEVRIAHFMANNGHTYKEIAVRLNRTTRSVAQRLCNDRKKEKLWSLIG